MNYIGDVQRILWKFSYDSLEITIFTISLLSMLKFSVKYFKNRKKKIYLRYVIISLTICILMTGVFYIQFIQKYHFNKVAIDRINYYVRYSDDRESKELNEEDAKKVNDLINAGKFRITYNIKAPYQGAVDQIELALYSTNLNNERIYVVVDPDRVVIAYSPAYHKKLHLYINNKELYNILNNIE